MPPGELKKCFSAYCELHIAGPDSPGSPDVPLPCPYTSGDHASVRVPSSPWWPTHDKSCPSPTGRLSGFFQLLVIQIYSCLQKYLPANCNQACPVFVGLDGSSQKAGVVCATPRSSRSLCWQRRGIAGSFPNREPRESGQAMGWQRGKETEIQTQPVQQGVAGAES